ncbi:MAG: FHA domain-containing protein [Nocardioides sp.]
MTEDLSTVRSYRSGGWFGIFGDHASVLLPPSEKARVGALWELVDSGSDFNELLDALITSGLRALPGFVLVSSGDEPTRVVLRGAARATFTLADGETVEVDGGEAATWVEKILHGVAAVQVHLEDQGGSTDYVMETGLVRVSRVDEPPYAEPAADAAGEPVAEPAAGPADQTADASGDVAFAPAPLPAGGFTAPVVVPLGELTDEESAREAPAPNEDTGAPGEAPGDVLADEPFAAYAEGPDSEEPANQEPTEQGSAASVDQPTQQFDAMQHDAGDYEGEPAGSFAAHAEGQAAEEPAAEEPVVEEPAAEEPFVDEHEEESHWPFSDPDPTGEQPAVEPAAPDSAPEPPSAPWSQAQGHVYDPAPAPGNPFAAAPPVPPVPPVPAGPPAVPPFDDHDGNTVAGGWDPHQFARQQPGIPGQPQAPSVTARAVARLVFSSGETVDVDRAVLIGRAPEARRFTSTDQPRLVTVPSPHQEISSTHVEVRPGSGADHGSAVVTDMGSTNGTVLTQPGLDEEDLQPGMAVQLLPGAIIDLGDGVTIRVTNL